MNRLIVVSLLTAIFLLGLGCETISKYKTTIIATGIGCSAGLALGAIADEMARKKDAKSKQELKNKALGVFREKKKFNKGKIVGLGVGCLAGLGTGLYLDIMKEDMQEQMSSKGITLEKEDTNGDGETDDLLVKMDGDISYETGSATLKGAAKDNVAKLAEAVQGYPETGLKIWGHTDGTGSRATNDKLSLQRAESVKSTLTSLGVDSGRVDETKGFANEKPLPGTDASGNVAKNRRVEVRIIAED